MSANQVNFEVGLQACLACGELERPFFYPLLKMFVRLAAALPRRAAFIDFFDDAQGMEDAPSWPRTGQIEFYPDRFTGFPYESFLQLKCGISAAAARLWRSHSSLSSLCTMSR